ncbi:hypothetical protein F4778DRAFT_770564 [Xylariomycetidae sp. FL2044]|nr:hypothetical protein F4778DRAFT_770564 [Xylariomycetidae sp. FL2044]
MAADMKLHLFGDQTFDIQPHLQGLLLKRDDLFLRDFLDKAYSAVRLEIYKLPSHIRDGIPRFTSLEDMFLWDRTGKRCIALDMALTTIYHIGIFISHADASSYDAQYTRVIGLCTGAFAAAAVSCSRNTADLIPNAVDAVVTALKTGLLVSRVADRLDQSGGSQQRWAMIVPGSASASAVQQFCAQSTRPVTSRPYISAYAPNGITVSGPPQVLEELAKSPSMRGIHSKTIPIHAAYHASHLYSHQDAKDVVHSSSNDIGAENSQQIPPLSRKGVESEGRGLQTLLTEAAEHVLLQPLRWSSILDDLQTCLRETNPSGFIVVPIGTTADQLIYTAMKQTPLRTLLPNTSPAKHPAPPQATADFGSKRPKLAIVGMSGRFPSANTLEAFWDVLYQGLDVVKPVPELRWDAKTHVDPTMKRKNTSATGFGCWLDNPAEFDARFFNISPREAPQIDPAQRLALMTAYEAMEQAGLVADATPSTRPDRVGTYYGVASNEWLETNSSQNIDTYFIPGGNRPFIAGRINYCFKFSGPSYVVDTACSSSLAAIHLACNALWQGDVDTAIAGGTNVMCNPDLTAGLDRGHFLSHTGNCKPFDDGADGYCRGDGIATLIIKRLDDALAENDPILGVILGAYTNHSSESVSITRPHAGAQFDLFSKILSESGVDPNSVGYIEMHGTGTQAGDASEMSSVLTTFAPPASPSRRARKDNEALYLGSVKANIGHGESASGASSIIKILQMMEKNTIVPHIGIKTKINHRFPTDLDARNVRIALEPTAWEYDPARPRRAFVNNFSAAGGNTSVLIEDAPPRRALPDSGLDSRKQYPIGVAAKCGVSLQGNLRSMLKFLQNNPGVSLGQLSYTTTARRMQHPHRVLLTGASAEEICAKIETALQNNSGVTKPKRAPNVVFSFTGQGAQYPGMGKQLFEESSFVRTELLQLDQIVQGLGFPSILPVIQSDEKEIGIFAPSVVQLAGVCLQIALGKLWASWNIRPTAVVGHSLGEYAALNVAGVLSDADTIFLVGERAKLLEKKCTRDSHAMLVVKGSESEIASVLTGRKYETACINSPIETVLAGTQAEVATLKELLTAAGMKTTMLKVPYAFHSSQLDPVLADFQDLAAGVTFSKPKVPVIRPLDATIADQESNVFGPAYLARHSRESVNMMGALSTAYSEGTITDSTIMIELGPHPATSGMVKAVLGQQVACVPSLQRGRQPWDVLAAGLKTVWDAGSNINWNAYQSDFTSCHAVVALPTYSWDLKDYWMKYVHDWTLRKGDPPLVINNAVKLISTTIHSVVEESGDSTKTRLVVEADIQRKDLAPIVQGHEVDGAPLATPSVYGDIALTMGTYLQSRYQPQQQDTLVDVSDMVLTKMLILRDDVATQPLQAHAEADWATQSVSIKFMSFDNKGRLQEHGRCVVRYKDRSQLAVLEKGTAATKQKLQALRDGVATGQTERFNRHMIYRAVRPLARFHDDYRAMEEIVINNDTLETLCRLDFSTIKRDGEFYTHPAILDALMQASGWTMNCNVNTDLDVEVFMNHGWGSFQLYEPIDYNKEYIAYTRMHAGADNLWHGDSVIFDGDKVVAFYGQIAIQAVPRRILKVIMAMEMGKNNKQGATRPALEPARSVAAPTKKAEVAPVKKAAPAPVSKPVQASRTTKSQPPRVAKGLSIIVEESGLEMASLTDDTDFTDVGIDSLLGLTIAARFKEELDIDVDFNELFVEHPTVKDMKVFLGGEPEDGSGLPPSLSSSDTDSESPLTSIDTPPDTGIPSSKAEIDFSRALQIISEESGIAMEDLDDETNFADSGVDSLLSLVITSRFQEAFGLDFAHDSVFMECETVGDLKQLLQKELGGTISAQPVPATKPVAAPSPAEVKVVPNNTKSVAIDPNVDAAALQARQKAVDELVQKYTAGYSPPSSNPSAAMPGENDKVVLVTGATGSLGNHIVWHLAQQPDIKTVVCLNRENREQAEARQYKSMRDKGIRVPDSLKAKFRVFQTDAAKPMLGLARGDYESLAGSVTHLIHNAWPMTVKRPLSGFEPQLQVFRELVNLAGDAASRRPAAFRFGFQMVSSISVVGNYEVATGKRHIVVPEERAAVEALLPNGYAEAKWGCERMLDATLHRHADRFRPMVVRLGQIAGSKTSGYWNPMEHFGFMIKSSQTLRALPAVGGRVYWTPVNDIAATLVDLVVSDRAPHPVYHIDNPVGQPWAEVNAVLADALGVPLVPFEEWLARVRSAPQRDNPAAMLSDFLDTNYLRMSGGGLILDVKKTLEHSKTLAAVGPVSETVVRKYIHIWRETGFLKSTPEEKARMIAERSTLWPK